MAQKEYNEAMNGLESLKETDFLTEMEGVSIYSDATARMKLVTSLIKKIITNINHYFVHGFSLFT